MIKREIAGWTRWLHIYLSMFSFAALLFFAITGITLNHTSWIEGQQRVDQRDGQLTLDWVERSATIDKLQIVEFLISTHGINARVNDFLIDDDECSISFKGPGYAADAFVDRTTGSYELTITKSGAVAIMNDLHKGRDTGSVWAWLIDFSAVLMILVSLSGFIMIFFLKNKLLNGLLLTAAGAIVIIVIYYLFAR